MNSEKIHVVVVDDERDIADYVGGLIGAHFPQDTDITVFYSGSRAREYLRQEPCGLLVADIRMPVVSGLDLLGYVADSSPETEVVLLTAHREFDYIYEASRKKKVTYLIKSEREKVLLEEIGRVIGEIQARRREQLRQSEVELLVENVYKLAGGLERIRELRRPESPENPEVREWLSSIRAYIGQNIEKGLTLNSLAAHFHYHPAYLSKAFRQTYGVKLSDYMMQCKMEAAKRYLRETDIAIIDLSECLGYQSAQSFIRAFHKEVGMTPQEYRRLQSMR
jgi:two-component system response regulator YesN